MPSEPILRVALVGSGFIADVHLQVLRGLAGLRVVAVCDTVRERAERLARRHGIAAAFGSLDELLAAGGIDAAHVLVPPRHHAEVARRCLEAGLHVLVEKPLALARPDVEALRDLARSKRLILGTNHNQVFHPAVQRLLDHVAAGRLGRLEHLMLVHNVPLRQLQSGDVGHFMFQTEANILLEQGVHLFSIVHALLGPGEVVQAVTGPRQRLPNGIDFVAEWDLHLRCQRGSASVRLAFGRRLLETTLHAIGSDGAAFVDLQRNACWLRRKTRWLDFLDHGRNLAAGGLHLLRRGAVQVAGYGLSLFGLRFAEDPFLRSMRSSLHGFATAVRSGQQAPCPPEAALAVLDLCAGAAQAAGVRTSPPVRRPWPSPTPPRAGEIVVLGGNGQLGRRCVRRLLDAGRPVTLLVRRPELLPEEWHDQALRVFVGDAADPVALASAIAGADAVLHLATVAGEDPARVETVMAAAVRAAGQACSAAGVRRLVYASSTAALYLGDAGATVTGDTPPDARPALRAPYARGKIAAERELEALRTQGLDVVVVRPAIVLSAEAAVEHSGVGLWVRDNHCVGWGTGATPLPLVLADDCAAALVQALFAAAARGRSYNLAGDVRLSAREFVAEITRRTGRDCHFHPTPLWWMWLQELGKHVVKFAARRPREFPQLRDLRSRSFAARLDCSDSKRDLGFAPEADVHRFLQRVFPDGKER